MRLRIVMVAAAVLLPVRVLAAQAPAAPSYERGCRGDEIQGSLNATFGTPDSYPVVSYVQAGSPADVAGLRVGDTLVAQDSVDMMQLMRASRRFAVGDTLRITLRRAGGARDVALVLGRRDTTARDAEGRRVCRPTSSR